MALGRCRSTAKIHRSLPGIQIVPARPASAAMVADATASGVVANGAGSSPAVIRVLTNPGRTTSTRTPVDATESERLCQRVQPGLGGAVDRIGRAGPLDGHRREQHQRALAALSQLAKRLEQERARPEEIDAHHPGGLRAVGVEARLGSEHADGEHNHVEPVRGGERALNHLRMRGEVVSVEQRHLGPSQTGRRALEAGAIAPEEPHPRGRKTRTIASPISEVPPTSSTPLTTGPFAGRIRAPEPSGIGAVPQFAPLPEPRVHRAQRVGSKSDIL